jgi:signal transduction histidine kinase/CheY-like chemotaxis protein
MFRTKFAETDLLLKQSNVACFAALVNATIYTYLSWLLVDQTELVAWYVAIIGTVILRLILPYEWHRRKSKVKTEAALRRWRRLMVLGVAVSGLCWGIVGSVFFNPESEIHQALTFFLVAGMSSGAVVAYSASMAFVYLYLILVLMPLIATLSTLGGEFYWCMTAITFLYLVLMIQLGRVLHRITHRNLELGFSNIALVEELKDKLCQLERTKHLEIERDVAAAANRAKTEFLANASHEIRSPITAIYGYVHLLKQAPELTEKTRRFLDVIHRQSEHLTHLVNDLLELSRMEFSPDKIRLVNLSLANELRNLIEVHRETMQNKKLIFNFNAGENLPTFIQTDSQKLKQVLANLLSNAVKYTDQGQITLDAERTEDDAIRFKVTDTGPGIDDATVSQIFSPFTRSQQPQIQAKPGSGLGLSVAHKAAKLLGGELKLTWTELGKGTSFEFILPMRPQAPAAHEPTKVEPDPPTKKIHGTVLVVEDSPDLRELIGTMLKQAGATVDSCSNGLAATQLAFLKPYKAILMDIKMPVMDGYQATSILRERGFTAPIIALTAHTSEEEKERCLKSGFTDHLSKPFTPSHLFEILDKNFAE